MATQPRAVSFLTQERARRVRAGTAVRVSLTPGHSGGLVSRAGCFLPRRHSAGLTSSSGADTCGLLGVVISGEWTSALVVVVPDSGPTRRFTSNRNGPLMA